MREGADWGNQSLFTNRSHLSKFGIVLAVPPGFREKEGEEEAKAGLVLPEDPCPFPSQGLQRWARLPKLVITSRS